MEELVGLLGEEGASVGVLVEFGWEWAHEDISHDEVVEAFWDSHGLDSKHALGVLSLSDLKDVVVWCQNVVSSINGKCEVGKAVKSRAVFCDGDSINQWINNALWSSNEGSTRVDNTHVSININGLVSLLEASKVKCPVSFLFDLVLSNFAEFGIFVLAWDHNVGFIWVVVEVEAEGVLSEVALVDENWEFVDRDGWVTKSEDTVELRNEEHGSLGLCDLTEGHCLGNGVSHGHSVLGGGSSDTTRSVLNIEILAILLVGAGLAAVISCVTEAGNAVAAA